MAPYAVPLRYEPWTNAACLKLVNGDRVYSVQTFENGVPVTRWVVMAAADTRPVVGGTLVWTIGKGAETPGSHVVPPFQTTFHIERWWHRSDPNATDTVTLQIIAGSQVVDTKVFKAPPDLEAVDVDYVFEIEQLRSGVRVKVSSVPNQWADMGTFVVRNASADLNGTVAATIFNGRNTMKYVGPPLHISSQSMPLSIAATSPLGYNDNYDPGCGPHTFTWSFTPSTVNGPVAPPRLPLVALR